MGPTEFHHNEKYICKVQLNIKNIKCLAMTVFANPVASILTDMCDMEKYSQQNVLLFHTILQYNLCTYIAVRVVFDRSTLCSL
jgi:hypothetical protein